MQNPYKQKLFDEYLKIIPYIKYLEKERKKTLFPILFVKLLLIGITIGCLCWVNIMNLYDAQIGGVDYVLFFVSNCLVLVFVILFYYCFKAWEREIAKKYSKELKQHCFDRILNIFDFIKSNSSDLLFTSWTQHYIRICYDKNNGKQLTKCDDSFSGTYKNVDFSIAEIQTAHIQGLSGLYSGPWDGVFFEMKFNKKIKAPIVITPKWDMELFMIILDIIMLLWIAKYSIFCSIIGLIGTMAYITNSNKNKYSKVSLEDVNFEKKYYVKATDQVEARYILTTAFMEKLEKLKTAFNSKDIRVFFEDDTMTIAIGTKKDLFEIGSIYHSIYSFKQIEQFYNEIMAITEMIDHFKLDEKTGL